MLRIRKQAKLQLLKDPSEVTGEKLINIRREASRYFRNKRREHVKEKINEFVMNNKNKNIGDLCRERNEFERVYQPRNDFVKDENGDMIVDPRIF
jgi:hypothetical protein